MLKALRNNLFFIIVLFVTSILILVSLNKEFLWDWDECLYAVNAREMLASGHFLTNIWNGYLDFQKPPGYTWSLLVPRHIFSNEFGIRILSVIFGLSLITSVYIFSKKYFSQTVAILSALLLLSSELIVIYSRHANTDIGFTLLVFLGVWSWIASWKKYKFSYLSGLFFGLAVMMKGLGSISFLAAIFASIFLNFKKEKLLNFIRLSFVFLTVIIPWHLVTYKTYGYEFFRVYILENIIKRSKYPIEFHRERWWFYFKLLASELKPWIFAFFIVPISYLINFRRFLSIKNIQKEFKDKELIFTILLLILIPLVSIIRVRTKLAWYAMPLYPFLAVYLAYNIDLLIKKLKLKYLMYALIIILSLDALNLLINETKVLKPKEAISPRNEIVMKSREYPYQELNYLVPFSERQARQILPPEEQIPQTWIFGGHPCAVYYSQKKVHYYYSVEEFKKDLTNKKGLFLIENGDLNKIKDIPVKINYKNQDYTLFEKN